MSNELTIEAYNRPIEDGMSRILLNMQAIECEIENAAPDFVSAEKDEVSISIQISQEVGIAIPKLDYSFPLEFKGYTSDDKGVLFNLIEEYIWFDIEIDKVKDIWVSDLSFRLESKHGRYLTYYITSLNHQLQWLQPELKTGEIICMSTSTKKFKPPKISLKESFSALEVIRCADMIARSIKKIDLRTGGAYVKLNTNKGKLESLIIGIGDKLGYIIEPLEKSIIYDMNIEGKNVSHAIYLK